MSERADGGSSGGEAGGGGHGGNDRGGGGWNSGGGGWRGNNGWNAYYKVKQRLDLFEEEKKQQDREKELQEVARRTREGTLHAMQEAFSAAGMPQPSLPSSAAASSSSQMPEPLAAAMPPQAHLQLPDSFQTVRSLADSLRGRFLGRGAHGRRARSPTDDAMEASRAERARREELASQLARRDREDDYPRQGRGSRSHSRGRHRERGRSRSRDRRSRSSRRSSSRSRGSRDSRGSKRDEDDQRRRDEDRRQQAQTRALHRDLEAELQRARELRRSLEIEAGGQKPRRLSGGSSASAGTSSAGGLGTPLGSLRCWADEHARDEEERLATGILGAEDGRPGSAAADAGGRAPRPAARGGEREPALRRPARAELPPRAELPVDDFQPERDPLPPRVMRSVAALFPDQTLTPDAAKSAKTWLEENARPINISTLRRAARQRGAAEPGAGSSRAQWLACVADTFMQHE